MKTFRAFRLHAGTPAPRGVLETLEVDALSPGDVVIRVAYSSINYKDALAAHGLNGIIRDYPRIGGIDLTGTVESSADPRWQPGDRVIVHGFGIGVQSDGGHAEYARVSGDWVLRLPDGLSLREAAIIGVAGYTAALSVHWMERNGLAAAQGPVLVTGGTGGVGSMAVDMLATAGYAVTAMTGKPQQAEYLRAIGAADVIGRIGPDAENKPLLKARWAGAIDAVGGETLAWITRTMQPEGVIAAFGNTGGPELQTTVLPFILRGIKLLGINANSPMPLRQQVWQRIATDLRPRHVEEIANLIRLDELPEWLRKTLAGEVRGRTVIDMQAA